MSDPGMRERCLAMKIGDTTTAEITWAFKFMVTRLEGGRGWPHCTQVYQMLDRWVRAEASVPALAWTRYREAGRPCRDNSPPHQSSALGGLGNAMR